MNLEVPTGCRRMRFGDMAGGLWKGEIGDLVEERGPRIGKRYWRVVDLHHAKRWTHVALEPLSYEQVVAEALEADRPTIWVMT